jgi:hypothetical protein
MFKVFNIYELFLAVAVRWFQTPSRGVQVAITQEYSSAHNVVTADFVFSLAVDGTFGGAAPFVPTQLAKWDRWLLWATSGATRRPRFRRPAADSTRAVYDTLLMDAAA